MQVDQNNDTEEEELLRLEDKIVVNLFELFNEVDDETAKALLLENFEEFVNETISLVEMTGGNQERGRLQLREWMLEGKFSILFANVLNLPDIQERIRVLADEGVLFHKWSDHGVGTQRLTSVYYKERVREKLGNDAALGPIFDAMDKVFDLFKLWMNWYLAGGRHSRHSDNGYNEEQFRLLMNLLEGTKTMSYTVNAGNKGGKEWTFAFKIHHGMAVLMNGEVGGCMKKSIEHAGSSADNTGFFGMDFGML